MRDYQSYPSVNVVINNGVVRGEATITFNGANTVYLDANNNSITDPSRGLTVRGIRYGVSLHATRNAETGEWGPTTDTANRSGYYSLYVSRLDSTNRTPSDSARHTILVALLATIKKAVSEHDLLHGEYVSLNNKAYHVEIEIEAAEKKLAESRHELFEINEQIARCVRQRALSVVKEIV